MNETEENEHPLDDFEVEIISLDQPARIPHRNTMYVASGPNKASTRRLRNTQWLLMIIVSSALLTFLVIPKSFDIVQSIAQKTVLNFIPPPVPALPPGYNSFYIDKDIPWSKVFIDGSQVRLPRIGLDRPLNIGRGHHLISWRAEPFQTQTCLLSIPFAIDDSCLFAFNQVAYKSSAYQVILLRESLYTMATSVRDGLVSTIQAELGGLSTSEVVQPGEQYTTQSGPVTAQQRLRATLHFQLDTKSDWVCFATMLTRDGVLCGIDKQDCRQLCSAPWQFRQQAVASSTASGWLTLVMTRSSWDYATQDGRIVERHQPVGPLGTASDQQLLLLRVVWDGSWQVRVLLGPDLGPPMYTNTKFRSPFGRNTFSIPDTVQVADDPACNAARSFVVRGMAVGPQVGDPARAMVRFISSSSPGIGCLVEISAPDQAPTTSAALYPPAYYIVRFGVLLTANPVAYLLRPALPRADAYELSQFQKLAALPGQIFTNVVNGS